MENPSEINKSPKMAPSSTFRNTAGRVPMLRSVPLQKVNDIKEKLQNPPESNCSTRPRLVRQRTFTKEEKKENGTAEKKPETAMKSEKRRQWKSFDLGVQEPFPFVLHQSEKEEEEFCEDNNNKSDAHFMRLREDLAEEGCSEGHLKMAEDLLRDVKDLDEDELKYRQEQSMFWTIKAVEMGSREALARLKEMTKKHIGITDQNRREALTYVQMSMDEIVGHRIGKKIFRSFSAGLRNYVPLCQFEDAAVTSIIDNSGKFVESEAIFLSKKSERLCRDDCIKAGCEFVNGKVPDIDEKLRLYEQTQHGYSENILLKVYCFIWILICSAQSLIVTSVFIQMCLGFCLYHLVLHKNLLGLIGALNQHSLSVILPIAMLHMVSWDRLRNKRHVKWQNIFRSTQSPSEQDSSRRQFLVSEDLACLSRNLLISLLLLLHFATLGRATCYTLVAFIFISVIHHRHFILLMLLILPVLFGFDRIPVQTITAATFDLPAGTDVATGEIGLTVLGFLLIFMKSGVLPALNGALLMNLAMICQAFICISVEERPALSDLRWTFSTALSLMSAVVLLMFSLAIRKNRALNFSLLLLMSAALAGQFLLSSTGLLGRSTEVKPSLTWLSYRDLCPSDLASSGVGREDRGLVASQLQCFHSTNGKFVQWEGEVDRLRMIPKTTLAQEIAGHVLGRNWIYRLHEHLSSTDEICESSSPPSSSSSSSSSAVTNFSLPNWLCYEWENWAFDFELAQCRMVRAIKTTYRSYLAYLPNEHDGVLVMKISSTALFSKPSYVQVNCPDNLWKEFSSLEIGTGIRVGGYLITSENFFEEPIINAETIVLKRN